MYPQARFVHQHIKAAQSFCLFGIQSLVESTIYMTLRLREVGEIEIRGI